MITIGLIGGVACGKSAVAREFGKRGAAVLDADRAGHEVLRQPEVIAELVARWGSTILDASGQIQRSAVAQIVFSPAGDADRQFLNQLTHPRIALLLRQELDRLKQADWPVAILDAALLLEAGWDKLCDHVVFVQVPRNLRLERARLRGWNEQELARRETSQLPIEEKRRRATLLLDNSGSLEDLDAQVEQLWQQVVTKPES
jgi:dephospho-CoA kinase